MSALIDANTEYLTGTTSVPSNINNTMAGWCYIVSDLGSVNQAICSLNSGSISYLTGLVWNAASAGNVMQVLSFEGVGFSISSANFASRPAVGTWFYAWTRCAGTGANQHEAGWALMTDTAFTKASHTLSPNRVTADNMLIGADSTGLNEAANARYAGWKVWDAVLTDAELLIERQRYWPARTANLNRVIPMLDQTASNLGLDMSGAGRNMSNFGTLTVESNPPGVRRDGRRQWAA